MLGAKTPGEASPRALEGSGLVAGSGGGGTPASRAPCGRAPRAGGGECGTIQASLAPPQRPPPNLSPPTSRAGAPAPTPLPHPGTRRSRPSSARGHSALPGDAGDPRTCGCPRCPVRRPKAGTRRGRWTQGPVGRDAHAPELTRAGGCAPRPGESVPLQAPSPKDAAREVLGGLWGGPLVAERS